MWQWWMDEARERNHEFVPNIHEWTFESVKDSPLQTNSVDCGVFVIMYANFLIDNIPLDESSFTESNMEYFRSKIIHDMLLGYLDYPLIVL